MQIEGLGRGGKAVRRSCSGCAPTTPTALRYHLVQIAEARGKPDLAIRRFREGGRGRAILSRQERARPACREGREVKRLARRCTKSAATRMSSTGCACRSAGSSRRRPGSGSPVDLLVRGLLRRPDGRPVSRVGALLAERMGRHEVMEVARKLIALEEDTTRMRSPHWLLASADRGERLEEAQSLIDRAAALSPTILSSRTVRAGSDSVAAACQGRLGDAGAALAKIRPGPEIAAQHRRSALGPRTGARSRSRSGARRRQRP